MLYFPACNYIKDNSAPPVWPWVIWVMIYWCKWCHLTLHLDGGGGRCLIEMPRGCLCGTCCLSEHSLGIKPWTDVHNETSTLCRAQSRFHVQTADPHIFSHIFVRWVEQWPSYRHRMLNRTHDGCALFVIDETLTFSWVKFFDCTANIIVCFRNLMYSPEHKPLLNHVISSASTNKALLWTAAVWNRIFTGLNFFDLVFYMSSS